MSDTKIYLKKWFMINKLGQYLVLIPSLDGVNCTEKNYSGCGAF